MNDICGRNSKPGRILRNGMDFVPKKRYPPDYSNVPSVRDWQMSPFSQERFDLDEIQRAEKKGFKGRAELEMVKRKYGLLKERPRPPPPNPCEECAQRRRATGKEPCTSEVLYQPYGPAVVSTVSYSKPELGIPRMYTYLGPSFYSEFKFKTSTRPCSELTIRSPKLMNIYIPYGPYGELRLTPDLYTPMGPSILPVNLAF